MTFKSFLTVFVSGLLISFPQNIIGCGPDADAYDYHTGFFLRNLYEDKLYKPFGYSSYTFLYDAFDEESQEEILAREWADYCGTPVNANDAANLVFGTSLASLKSLYAHASGKKKLAPGDSLLSNPMAIKLSADADLEALGYLQYAKSVEPYVIGQYEQWEPFVRDSVKMSKLIKNGIQLHAAAKKEFFKLKYGYQVMRLAHYSGQYKEAVSYYDRFIAGNSSTSVLQHAALSLKAGALYRSGNKQESAYLFSKAFAASPVKRMSNYLGLLWGTDHTISKDSYLAYCQNNEEKANLLGMMSIFGTQEEFASMKEVYRLDPKSSILELMAVREVNKIEEIYYSPSLSKQPGGDILNYSWTEPLSRDSMLGLEKRIREMGDWFHQVAQLKKVKKPALFELAASYVSMMLQNWDESRERLDLAATMPLTERLQDQMAMINLLLMVNSPERLDAGIEKKLLPSLEWLKTKAVSDNPSDNSRLPYDKSQWIKFYRSIWSEIMAKKYHQQQDVIREVLCVGAAEWIFNPTGNSYWGIGFLRNKMGSKELNTLYQLMKSNKLSPFEAFLLKHNAISEKLVVDFAGTAFLRDQNYAEAIKWFKLSPSSNVEFAKDPFIDILYDRSDFIPGNTTSSSKLSFATEMQRLHEKAALKDKDEAMHLYKIALGLYNTTYYGYAWELVEYGRSGSDGYAIPEGATPFKKNYYGCFDAHDYFKRAKQASHDPEWQARCLFMMAKCLQKQIHQPQYREYSYNDYEQYSLDMKKYDKQFMENPYFPELMKEYGNTKFFKEANRSCSYLKDFVGRQKK